MALFEVTSGNIVEGVRYSVIGGTSIVYNAITYNAGTFFVGVSGVTTYTKIAGTEIVTEASFVDGANFGFENDFYLGLYNDASTVLGASIGSVDPAYMYEVESGNIVEGQVYQVYRGTSVTYNSIEYFSGEFFTGVSGVTTYTKTEGAEIVTYASTFSGLTPRIENNYYLDLFNEDSRFTGITPRLQDQFNSLFEVISGEIIEGVEYQVYDGDGVLYDGVTYTHLQFFTGVAGVTTYTKTSGYEIVIESSSFLGQASSIENDFYLGLFNDDSTFLGMAFEISGATQIYKSQIIRTTYKHVFI